MSFNFINSDTNKKTQGVWIEHESGRFKIGAPNTFTSTQCLEKHVQKVKGKRKDYQLKSSEQYKCAMEVIAELKLLDWEIEDENGDVVEYSKKAAVNALINDPEFATYVSEQSADHELFDKNKREEDVKK